MEIEHILNEEVKDSNRRRGKQCAPMKANITGGNNASNIIFCSQASSIHHGPKPRVQHNNPQLDDTEAMLNSIHNEIALRDLTNECIP